MCKICFAKGLMIALTLGLVGCQSVGDGATAPTRHPLIGTSDFVVAAFESTEKVALPGPLAGIRNHAELREAVYSRKFADSVEKGDSELFMRLRHRYYRVQSDPVLESLPKTPEDLRHRDTLFTEKWIAAVKNDCAFAEENKILSDFMGQEINVPVPSRENKTLLEIAIENKQYDMASLLLWYNADPNLLNRPRPPLCIAAYINEPRFVTLLLVAGAEIDVRDIHGRTALFYAAAYGATDTAKMLLEKGADPNAHNKFGDTPLHFAVIGLHLDVAKLLVQYGAQANARNSSGNTPYDVLCRYLFQAPFLRQGLEAEQERIEAMSEFMQQHENSDQQADAVPESEEKGSGLPFRTTGTPATP